MSKNAKSTVRKMKRQNIAEIREEQRERTIQRRVARQIKDFNQTNAA